MNVAIYINIFIHVILASSLVTCSRLLFYIFNFNYFSQVKFYDLLFPFFYGLRFDLATALIFNIPFIILSLIPLKFDLYKKFLKIVYILSNVLLLAINLVDIEYFKFNGKKLTRDIFVIVKDMSDQLIQLSLYYWYIPFAIFIFIYLLNYFFEKIEIKKEIKKVPYYLLPISSFLFLVISFIGIRGGLQMRSISPKQAFSFNQYEIGNFVLNSGYTLVRSLENEKQEMISYFKTDKEARNLILKNKSVFSHHNMGSEKKNIILIIVESLSQEYVDEGFTPFLESLALESLYFDRNFANGRRSIEALPSILLGVPSILDTPLSQSQFQTNYFNALPIILKKHGYSTSFFHGGKRGTMDFDSFTASIGIDEYYGKEDYTGNENDYDGAWGIFDHQFLKFMLEKLNKKVEPFFSTVFTLSSHQPYRIPKDFQGKFNKGNLEIHESIGYVDHALKLFFEQAKNLSWFKNTLFIITADHTQKLRNKKFQNYLGTYRVPLFFFYPGHKLSSTKKVTQQADIGPSILDFLGLRKEKWNLFGESVFSDGEGLAFFSNNGVFYLVRGNSYIQKNGEIVEQFNGVMDSQLESAHVGQQMLEDLKSYIQYGINGLIKNDLYLELNQNEMVLTR